MDKFKSDRFKCQESSSICHVLAKSFLFVKKQWTGSSQISSSLISSSRISSSQISSSRISSSWISSSWLSSSWLSSSWISSSWISSSMCLGPQGCLCQISSIFYFFFCLKMMNSLSHHPVYFIQGHLNFGYG